MTRSTDRESSSCAILLESDAEAGVASVSDAGQHRGGGLATFSVGHSYSVEKPSLREKLLRSTREDAARCTYYGAAVLAMLVVGGIFGLGLTMGEHRQAASDDIHQEGRLLDTLHSKFFVVGDWGREGDYNQSRVADVMALKAELFKPDFVVSTGDNFYPSGLLNLTSGQFNSSFANTYKQESLQVPWYAVLGNHDYGEGLEGAISSPLNELQAWQLDQRFLVRRTGQALLANGFVELFFIDTTPLIEAYRTEPWAQAEGGLASVWVAADLAAFEQSLAASTARWKIVIGHHPVVSNGPHSKQMAAEGGPPGAKELQALIAPLLQKYGVQAYICGHDHDLEYLRVPDQSVHYIVSGAGSKAGAPFLGKDNAVFQYPESGFVSCELHAEKLVCEFLGIRGTDPALHPLYTATIPQAPSAPSND